MGKGARIKTDHRRDQNGRVELGRPFSQKAKKQMTAHRMTDRGVRSVAAAHPL
jgi:hypothetical protein